MQRTFPKILSAVLLLSALSVHYAVAGEQSRSQTRVPAKRGTAPTYPATTETSKASVAEDSVSSGPFLGEVRMFAGTFAPKGWAICDGRLLKIIDHEHLYSLLGTTYGGDGRTTFALPDLRGKLPVTFIISLTGVYPSRS